LIAGAICLAIYLALGEGLHIVLPDGKGDPNVVRAMAAGLGLFAGLLSLVWTWPTAPRCTFVGSLGAAYLSGKWGRALPSERQVIVFRECAALFSATTHFYKNFIYQCTRYRFDWHQDANGPPQLTIADEHTCLNDLPEAGNLFHFALRVEDVWTGELISRLGELSADRALSFPCRTSAFSETLLGLASPNNIREIRLYLHQIQFVYPDKVETIAIRDLGAFQAHKGVLKFQQDDASWFSQRGKFRLDYQHLGNARAFLHFLATAVSAQYGPA
jgi:hypothetical protein